MGYHSLLVVLPYYGGPLRRPPTRAVQYRQMNSKGHSYNIFNIFSVLNFNLRV